MNYGNKTNQQINKSTIRKKIVSLQSKLKVCIM